MNIEISPALIRQIVSNPQADQTLVADLKVSSVDPAVILAEAKRLGIIGQPQYCTGVARLLVDKSTSDPEAEALRLEFDRVCASYGDEGIAKGRQNGFEGSDRGDLVAHAGKVLGGAT